MTTSVSMPSVSDSELSILGVLASNWPAYITVLQTRTLTPKQLVYWAAKAFPVKEGQVVTQDTLLKAAENAANKGRAFVKLPDDQVPTWAQLEQQEWEPLAATLPAPVSQPVGPVMPANSVSQPVQPAQPVSQSARSSQALNRATGTNKLNQANGAFGQMAYDELLRWINENYGPAQPLLALLAENISKGVDPAPILKRTSESALLRLFIKY